MQDYVSAQTYALRSAGNGRFGFAWSPRNLAAMPDSRVHRPDRRAAGAARLGDRRLRGRARGGVRPDWCSRSLAGAAFTTGWRTFATWKPSRLAFTTAAPAVAVGAASPTLTLELRTSTGVPYTAGLPSPSSFARRRRRPRSRRAGRPVDGDARRADRVRQQHDELLLPRRPAGIADDRRVGRGEGRRDADRDGDGARRDTTPPETTIGSAPAGLVATSAASVSFTASEAGSRFECSLDGAAFAACASPAVYSGLPEGAHAFDVRAIDKAGNVDASPARASWVVEPPVASAYAALRLRLPSVAASAARVRSSSRPGMPPSRFRRGRRVSCRSGFVR